MVGKSTFSGAKLKSPYAQVGAKIIDNGYSAIPVMPGSKIPGEVSFGKWYAKGGWNEFCNRLPSQYEVPRWEQWPDAGVCIAIDAKLKVVDIDTDDPDMMAAVLAVLPDSPVKKRGQKGFSAFYRGSGAIVSVPFSISVAGEPRPVRVVDLLAHGRQTVIPPTIHKDTGRPYEWTTEDTLIDTDIDQLPVLPDNIADVLAEVLAPFGYIATPDHSAVIKGQGDTCWREVNDMAVNNYSKWVPALSLPGTKPVGRNGYRAVAVWRGVENPNLSFHQDGIKDWGSNESHTPIDVVMKAFSTDFYTATKWLCDQIGFNPIGTDGYDVAGLIARSQAKKEQPVETLVAPEPVPVDEETIHVENNRIAAPRGGINPWDFDTHGGLMGKVSEWIYSTARSPVREFSTIASIAFLSALYGRRYVGPTGSGLNLYLIGIAKSGHGKDHPRKAIISLAHDVGLQRLIGPNKVTGDSAIEKVVRRRPCFVMPWDEIGVILQGVTGKNASPWSRSTRDAILELYSLSTGIWTGKEHADNKSDSSGQPIHCPTVSILGMSTPTEFYAGLTESNLKDGMVGRMTIIVADERPKRQDVTPLLVAPKSLTDAVKDSFADAPSKGNMAAAAAIDAGRKPVMHAAKWGDGAKAYWTDIENWQLDLIDEQPEQVGVVGRAAEQTIKIATIRAISRDPADPVVSLEDVKWGYSIVQQSLDTIDAGVKKYMSGSDFETLHKRILEIIEEAGESGISRSDMIKRRGVRHAKPQEFDSAVKWLESAELTFSKITTGPKGGRPGVRFYIKPEAALAT